MPLIPEPTRPPLLLRAGVWIAEQTTGRRMVPARMLGWAPRLGVGLGVMEALVEHDRPSRRLLRLARLTASLTVGCPFCMDMNAHRSGDDGVSEDEVAALRQVASANESWQAVAIAPLWAWTPREALVICLAHGLSITPPHLPESVSAALVEEFDEADYVRLCATIAQVNTWARFNVGLGIPPAGFSDDCAVPK